LLKDFTYHLIHSEISSAKSFLRLYYIQENSGYSGTLNALGANLLNHIKPHTNWFVHYLLAYGGYLEALVSPQEAAAFTAHYGQPVPRRGDHEAARWFADSDTRFMNQLLSVAALPASLGADWNGGARPTPDNPIVRQWADSLLRVPISRGGGRLISNSGLYHAEAQHEVLLPGKIQTIFGGNFRLFRLSSQGTTFIDSGGRPFYNWEAGTYLQARRSILKDKLTLTAGLRYDYRQYLTGSFTPRLAASYRVDRAGAHILRAAYQTGFRNPVTDALFIRLQGDILLIGALPNIDRQYGIAGMNNYTASSVQAYKEARAKGTPMEEAAKLLVSVPIQGIRPEKVSSIEVGSRHLVAAERLLLDFTYAYQRYRDFHSYILLYGPPEPQKQLSPTDVENNNLSPIYGRYYNLPGTPQAHFLTLSAQYRIHRYILLIANYQYAYALGLEEARRLDPQLYVFFNTPPHRVNAGLSLQNAKRWSAQLWYQWTHAHRYEYVTYFKIIPTYTLLHAQVSYKIPRWHSEIRLGAQNLLNFYHIEVAGGPRIGGLYYLQYSFDPLSL
ncbi:MAG: TonB-dependent receptor, partial [Bacteroidia bacterium]|nr:TonB-dependent receptor [Bacteroidia bacterium]MDW8135091.1 TonB-dependent receptor [Bacteroidia bacterium]